jgi:NADH-quinone oxidoreductase subunit L
MLNLPALFGGDAKLEHWLDPIIEGAHHVFPLEMPHGQTEFILIGLAIVIAVGGLILGYRVTMARPILPARQAAPEVGFWKVLYHKYYVDEIYAALIVRPLVLFSDRVLWKDVDQGLIDRGGVEGSARLARTLGWIGTRLQTGQVGVYLTVFLVGVLGIFFVVMG